MILSAPPQAGQGGNVDAKDAHQALRLRLIAARRSAGVGAWPSSVFWRLLPLPRLAGVTKARNRSGLSIE